MLLEISHPHIVSSNSFDILRPAIIYLKYLIIKLQPIDSLLNEFQMKRIPRNIDTKNYIE